MVGSESPCADLRDPGICVTPLPWIPDQVRNDEGGPAAFDTSIPTHQRLGRPRPSDSDAMRASKLRVRPGAPWCALNVHAYVLQARDSLQLESLPPPMSGIGLSSTFSATSPASGLLNTQNRQPQLWK